MRFDADPGSLNDIYRFILEIDKLKQVFRNTKTVQDRRESTAEHCWSASMIAMIVMQELKQEFVALDEFKIVKLILIHDLVEIYAGDVTAFDSEARKYKQQQEQEALEQLIVICPIFGKELKALWYEFEHRETLEAKIAKACDAICPVFQRVQTGQSYLPFGVSLEKLCHTIEQHFSFSLTFSALFAKLKQELCARGLIEQSNPEAITS